MCVVMKRINKVPTIIDADTTYVGEALEERHGQPVRIVEIRRNVEQGMTLNATVTGALS
jgi:hypothetical protein